MLTNAHLLALEPQRDSRPPPPVLLRVRVESRQPGGPPMWLGASVVQVFSGAIELKHCHVGALNEEDCCSLKSSRGTAVVTTARKFQSPDIPAVLWHDAIWVPVRLLRILTQVWATTITTMIDPDLAISWYRGVGRGGAAGEQRHRAAVAANSGERPATSRHNGHGRGPRAVQPHRRPAAHRDGGLHRSGAVQK